MAKKQLPAEFKEFIKFLNKNRVRYLLIGGWAVGLHANPRLKIDIDFLIGTDDKNIGKIVAALADFCKNPADTTARPTSEPARKGPQRMVPENFRMALKL